MMSDIDIKIIINTLVDFAYDKTIERMNAIEGASTSSVYQTILVEKGNYRSYLLSYLHYYCGCFEGILFTRFLEEFNRMPTPSENSFIKDMVETRFEDLKKAAADVNEAIGMVSGASTTP